MRPGEVIVGVSYDLFSDVSQAGLEHRKGASLPFICREQQEGRGRPGTLTRAFSVSSQGTLREPSGNPRDTKDDALKSFD
jgi:hypothetical protein